jgi:hypothetical protein
MINDILPIWKIRYNTTDRFRDNPSHLFKGLLHYELFSPLATAPFLQDRQNSIRIALSEYFELEGYHTIWYNGYNQIDKLWRRFIFPKQYSAGNTSFLVDLD